MPSPQRRADLAGPGGNASVRGPGVATASDTYTFVLEGANLKLYLGIVGAGEDTNLELWLDSAARDCDNLLKGEDFIDDDGNDVTHPATIRAPARCGGRDDGFLGRLSGL